MPECRGRDQAARAAGPGPHRRPPPARRAARPGLGRHPRAGLGTGGVRQDHPARHLAGPLRHPHPVAWVSLDERDRDAVDVLDLRAAAPSTGPPRARPRRPSRCSAAARRRSTAVLTALLNELSVLPGDLTLVLDDYHLAEGPDIRPGMVFLLEHLPPQVHLVISTRADPALPLARLRARGELVEVRAADLRFTGDEARDLPQRGQRAWRSRADDVAALERRTEGWAAALQLAALSLAGRDDRVAVHRRLRRRRPVRRRLPRRRGARPAAARRCAGSCSTPRSSTG